MLWPMSTQVVERIGSLNEAGDLLRELWSLGQKPTADELLRDVTGAPIEMEAVAEEIRAALPAPH